MTITIPATRYTRMIQFGLDLKAGLPGLALVVYEGAPTFRIHVFTYVPRLRGGLGFHYAKV